MQKLVPTKRFWNEEKLAPMKIQKKKALMKAPMMVPMKAPSRVSMRAKKSASRSVILWEGPKVH